VGGERSHHCAIPMAWMRLNTFYQEEKRNGHALLEQLLLSD